MHQQPVGVLVAQLGTPDAPTPKALRTYLAQFLSDMRVIDYSPFLWQPLLRGVILRTRPARSAKLYQRIWLEEGSPLMVYSQRQVEGLQARLGDGFRVVLGMTYGNPSIASAIEQLEQAGVARIVVLPMFPQFSSTTTSSIYDAVYKAAAGRRCPLFHERKRFTPTLRFIEPYYNRAEYIQAMQLRLETEIAARPTPPDHYIITFHGIPKRYITTGDPYRQQCEHTAQLLADAMGWQPQDWTLSFQSRFGPEEWLQPYTDEVIEHLTERGIQYPLIFSPGFVTDCLETLDELGNEGREQFEDGGGHGENYHLAPCLNDLPTWIDFMAKLVRENVGGWTEAASTGTHSTQPLYALSD